MVQSFGVACPHLNHQFHNELLLTIVGFYEKGTCCDLQIYLSYTISQYINKMTYLLVFICSYLHLHTHLWCIQTSLQVDSNDMHVQHWLLAHKFGAFAKSFEFFDGLNSYIETYAKDRILWCSDIMFFSIKGPSIKLKEFILVTCFHDIIT